MLWLRSVTSVSSMAHGRCFALRHCTLHPHPLHPRQVPQCLGTGTEMVTGKVKGWPWGPTARPHREERCVTWVSTHSETCLHLNWPSLYLSSTLKHSSYNFLPWRWLHSPIIYLKVLIPLFSSPHRDVDLFLHLTLALWALIMKQAYASWATSIPDSRSFSAWSARPACAASAVR